jgi:hypothetical protein
MKSISGKKLCKVVERFGWKLARQELKEVIISISKKIFL